jgi:hypothetical protein
MAERGQFVSRAAQEQSLSKHGGVPKCRHLVEVRSAWPTFYIKRMNLKT